MEHIRNSGNGTGQLQSPRGGSESPTEKIIVNVQPWMIFREVVPVPIKEDRTPAAEIKPSGSMNLSGAIKIAPPDQVVAQFPKKIGPSKSAKSSNADPTAPPGETMLTRKQVAKRWGCSTETVKRRGRDGTLRSLHFNGRNVRYRLEDVEKVEREAESLTRGP
jgi:hypothetical protein